MGNSKSNDTTIAYTTVDDFLPKPALTPLKPVQSQVARNFINNAINPELKTCPGVGLKTIELLTKHKITTTDHLIGQFFLVDRDEVKFIEFLEEVGMKNQFAQETARQFVTKFGSL